MKNNNINELICTRISHDIIGNIGAVGNAVELLEEGDMDFLDDIKDILKNNTKTLMSRLKFFRLAFGLDNSNTEDFDIVKEITQNYLYTLGNRNFPIELELNIKDIKNFKPAMIMIMIMADILLRGGKLIAEEEENKLIVKFANNLKFSKEKATKIYNNTGELKEANDAGLAPLALILDILPNRHIKLDEKDGYIALIAE